MGTQDDKDGSTDLYDYFCQEDENDGIIDDGSDYLNIVKPGIIMSGPDIDIGPFLDNHLPNLLNVLIIVFF